MDEERQEEKQSLLDRVGPYLPGKQMLGLGELGVSKGLFIECSE